MHQEEHNEYGCPIRNQTGATGIKHSATILAQLSPEQRHAFETERAARERELEWYVTTHGYHT